MHGDGQEMQCEDTSLWSHTFYIIMTIFLYPNAKQFLYQKCNKEGNAATTAATGSKYTAKDASIWCKYCGKWLTATADILYSIKRKPNER